MNAEILEMATKADPDTMLKTAQTLELIEHFGPEFLPEVFAEFSSIGEVTQEKVAAVIPKLGASPTVLKGLDAAARVSMVVGTGIAASLGSSIAADLFDSAKRGLTKSRNFKRIMDANPNLKSEVLDKNRIKPSFDALHRFAPDFMSDPLIGGGLLKAMANSPGGNEYQLMEKLISSRKSLGELKERQMRPDWKGARDLLNKARSSKGAPGE